MAWNGTGTYNLPPAYSPEVNGTTIDAARYNGLTSDVATGITAALAKNGENVPTANLPMGGFKHTGAGDANATGQYVAFNQATAVGSLTITTFTAGNINLTSSTVPANGLYLKAANNPALSSNTTLRWDVNSTGNHTFAAPTAGTAMTVTAVAGANTANFVGTTGTLINTNLLLQHDGTNAFFRTQNAGSLNLGANGSNNVTIASAGNVTVAAPSSGNTLNVDQLNGSATAIITSSSVAGNQANWQLANTSNTASSDARLVIQTAGSSANDPFIVFNINGFVAYAVGADNSDNDNFKISTTSTLGSGQSLVFTADGRLYGTALHNNAGAVTGTATQYIASGTYTPTLTNTTNVTSSNFTNSPPAKWTRVGNVVTVSGAVSIEPTTINLNTVLDLSLPIASNLANFEDCTGTANTIGTSSGTSRGAIVQGNVANDRAQIGYYAPVGAGTSQIFTFIFSYTVL